MNSVFTLRLDQPTSEKLSALAKLTGRTRASVVRWLISTATVSPDIASPSGKFVSPPMDSSHNSKNQLPMEITS
jgi:hypothetical protein